MGTFGRFFIVFLRKIVVLRSQIRKYGYLCWVGERGSFLDPLLPSIIKKISKVDPLVSSNGDLIFLSRKRIQAQEF
jgi:hypothetical protein